MHHIGTVQELWRYPVKSMRGEQLQTACFDPAGMVGDRRYALVSTAAPVGKPLVTSRERTRLLLYRPRLDPTPVVHTPEGATLPLPSPALLTHLQQHLADPEATLELDHSPDKPITDVRALSFISRATLDHLQHELGTSFTPQRLRNNLILQLNDDRPFAEEELDGQTLRFGTGPDATILRIHERIPRCRIVTLDPDTAATDQTLLRWLAKHRNARIAMYATVLHPGTITTGDPIHPVPHEPSPT